MDLVYCDGCEKDVLRPTIPDPGPLEHLCENCQGSLRTSLAATCPVNSRVTWKWDKLPANVKRALKKYQSGASTTVEVYTKDVPVLRLEGIQLKMTLPNGFTIVLR